MAVQVERYYARWSPTNLTIYNESILHACFKTCLRMEFLKSI